MLTSNLLRQHDALHDESELAYNGSPATRRSGHLGLIDREGAGVDTITKTCKPPTALGRPTPSQ